MTCLSFEWNEIILQNTYAEATDTISSELVEELLRLFEHDVALDNYYTILHCTLCGDEVKTAESTIAQLAHRGAWIAKVVTFLTKQERKGGL